MQVLFFLFRAVLVSISLLSVLLLSWKISLESHTHARTHARCTHTIKKMKSSVLLAEQIRPLVQISQALIQIHTKFLAHSLTQFHFYKPTTHSFHSQVFVKMRVIRFQTNILHRAEGEERVMVFFGGAFYRLRRMQSIKSFFFQYATKVQNVGFIFMLQLTCLRCCETKSRKLIWFGLYED